MHITYLVSRQCAIVQGVSRCKTAVYLVYLESEREGGTVRGTAVCQTSRQRLSHLASRRCVGSYCVSGSIGAIDWRRVWWMEWQGSFTWCDRL